MGNICCLESTDHAPDYFRSPAKIKADTKVNSQAGMLGGGGGHKSHTKPGKDVVFRFFMVGMGSAGKSTIIKQLQKLCKDQPDHYIMLDEEWQPISHEYPAHERERYRRIIRKNIFDSLVVLEHWVQQWSLRPSGSSAVADLVVDAAGRDTGANDLKMNDELVEALLQLISDPAILEALRRRSEMKGEGHLINDGTVHFLSHRKAVEVFSNTYLPTEEDIVHSRAPTTGIHDYRFNICKMNVQIHDIGGQRVERGKLLGYIRQWISSDNAQCRNFILYVVNTAEYNVPHPDHPDITLMDESMMMLQNILELQPIQNCGLLIFFNKNDVLKEKIQLCRESVDIREDTVARLGTFMKDSDKVALKNGNEVKISRIEEAVEKKFVSAIKQIQAKRYRATKKKFTCAVDTKMMAAIFNTVTDDILAELIDRAEW